MNYFRGAIRGYKWVGRLSKAIELNTGDCYRRSSAFLKWVVLNE